MSAIEWESGEPAGWWCDQCVAEWQQTGCPAGDTEAAEATKEKNNGND